MEECLSTLQFANRCRNVQNMLRVNYLSDATAATRRSASRSCSRVAALRQLRGRQGGGRARRRQRARRRRAGGGEGGDGDGDDDGATGVDYDDSGYDDDDGGGGAGGLDNPDVLKILEEVRTGARSLLSVEGARRGASASARFRGSVALDSSEHALSIRRFHALCSGGHRRRAS